MRWCSVFNSVRLATCLALLIAGCGDDGVSSAPDADLGLREFTISNMDASGEMHSFSFQCDELHADQPLTLVSNGDHAHAITLAVTQMQAILAGETVIVEFTEGHEHSVTIVKPGGACLEGAD